MIRSAQAEAALNRSRLSYNAAEAASILLPLPAEPLSLLGFGFGGLLFFLRRCRGLALRLFFRGRWLRFGFRSCRCRFFVLLRLRRRIFDRLFFGYRRRVDPLEECHRSGIAFALAEFHDAGVTALPFG